MGILAEIRDFEDGFSVGEVEPRKVGVEAGLWGSKIWDTGGGADSCARLKVVSEVRHETLQD
jgi:hypothetical protein